MRSMSSEIGSDPCFFFWAGGGGGAGAIGLCSPKAGRNTAAYHFLSHSHQKVKCKRNLPNKVHGPIFCPTRGKTSTSFPVFLLETVGTRLVKYPCKLQKLRGAHHILDSSASDFSVV